MSSESHMNHSSTMGAAASSCCRKEDHSSGQNKNYPAQGIESSKLQKQKNQTVQKHIKTEVPCKKKRNYTAVEMKRESDGIFVPLKHAAVAASRVSTVLKSEKLREKCISYQGSCNENGQCHGKGIMTYQNGEVYDGFFVNGKRHGTGKLTYADGTEYVGDWECNLQHGNGTRRWKNGEIYVGQYVHGQRSGEGSFYFQNKDVFTGQFEKGVMHGFGRYYYASGQRFEGCFWNGRRHGKGKLQRVDGSLDICVYKEDARIGVGVRWSADRKNAWELCSGKTQRKITLPEAIALDYEIDAAARALTTST